MAAKPPETQPAQPESSDAALVEDFKAGNKERAFTLIVKKYQQRLYWVARRLASDADDADDITQEAFIRAYQALQDFRSDAQLFTWLYRITVNVAMNQKRKRAQRETVDVDELAEQPVSDEPTPEEALERKEFRAIVDDAINALPEKQRIVFQMRYFDEMPYEEIAKALHKSVGGLKANYFHAVRKVADYVRKVHGVGSDENSGVAKKNEKDQIG